VLLALAVLMGVFAWRYGRNLERSRFHPLVLGAVGLASMSAIGGVGVISGAKAINPPTLIITDALLEKSGGRVTSDLLCGETNVFENGSGKSLTVLSIELDFDMYTVSPTSTCVQGGSVAAGASCNVRLLCRV
jgi:uncharacterized membrane protein YeiH